MKTPSILLPAVAGGLLVLSLAGCGSVRVVRLPEPHGHFGRLHAQPPSELVTSGVVFRAAAKVPADVLLVARSADRRFLAYTGHHPMPGLPYEPEMVFLIDSREGRDYVLWNEYFPHRLVSDLQWIDTRCFCFDIWTGPHYGVHYVVDARRKRLIHAHHFHDDFIEELEQESKRAAP